MARVFLAVASSRLPARRGFTLVELLVVIAIIAVLAAIIFPTFARVRESARRVMCMSNVKQIATATIMYVHDRGVYPWTPSPEDPQEPVAAGDFTAMAYLANRYVRDVRIFRCPRDRTRVSEVTNGRLGAQNSARASYDTVFAWSRTPESEVSRHGEDAEEFYPIPEGLVWDPASFPIWWDFLGGVTPAMLDILPSLEDHVNHGTDGGNVAYADGHAKWLPSGKWDYEGPILGYPGNNPGGIPKKFIQWRLRPRRGPVLSPW